MRAGAGRARVRYSPSRHRPASRQTQAVELHRGFLRGSVTTHCTISAAIPQPGRALRMLPVASDGPAGKNRRWRVRRRTSVRRSCAFGKVSCSAGRRCMVGSRKARSLKWTDATNAAAVWSGTCNFTEKGPRSLGFRSTSAESRPVSGTPSERKPRSQHLKRAVPLVPLRGRATRVGVPERSLPRSRSAALVRPWSAPPP